MSVIVVCAEFLLFFVSVIVTSTVYGTGPYPTTLLISCGESALLLFVVAIGAKLIMTALAFWRKSLSSTKRSPPLVFIFGPRGCDTDKWLYTLCLSKFGVGMLSRAVPESVEEQTPTNQTYLILHLLGTLYYHRDANLLAVRKREKAQIAEKSKANCLADAIYAYMLGLLTDDQIGSFCRPPLMLFDETTIDLTLTYKQSTPQVVMVYCSESFEDCCRNIAQRNRSRIIDASRTKMETFVYAYVMLLLMKKYKGIGFIDDEYFRAKSIQYEQISFERGRERVETCAKNNMEILMTQDQANRFKKVVDLLSPRFVYFGKTENGSVLVRAIDREIDNQVHPIALAIKQAEQALDKEIHDDKKQK